MILLNHLSDNQLRLTSIRTEDNQLPFDVTSNWLKIHFRCGGDVFTAINEGKGGEGNENCHIEDGILVIDIPSNTFKYGNLEYMTEVREDSGIFHDGYKNTLSLNYKPCNIKFV